MVFQFRRRSDHFPPYSRLFNDLPLSLVSSSLPPPGLHNPLWFGLIPHLPLGPCAIRREQRVISPQQSLLLPGAALAGALPPLSPPPARPPSTSSQLQSGQPWVGAVSLETLRVTACRRPWLHSSSAVDAADFTCPSTLLGARSCASPPAQQRSRPTHLCPPRVMPSPALWGTENPDELAEGRRNELELGVGNCFYV